MPLFTTKNNSPKEHQADIKKLRPQSAILSVIGFAVLTGFAWFLFCSFIGSKPYTEKRLGLHTVKRHANSTSLRFAMVHDILHQRFKKHGDSWHQARIRERLLTVTALEEKIGAVDKAPDSDSDTDQQRDDPGFTLADLIVFDDLAVSYDRLHQGEKGLQHLEHKRLLLLQLAKEPRPLVRPADFPTILKSQLFPARGLAQDWNSNQPSELKMAWYRYYANRATLLIHLHMRSAISGDAQAVKELTTAAKYIATSICLNPQAHFGREIFQFIALNNIIAYTEDPQRLYEYGILGNQKPPLGEAKFRSLWAPHIPHYTVPSNLTAQELYTGIPKVYLTFPIVNDRDSNVDASIEVPFDEAIMGILGMWMYGGGANPHFALCLASIMDQIGQRRIAWSGYRRALDLSERYWSDPEIIYDFKQYCQARMQAIEAYFPGTSDENAQRFENALIHELQRGIDYQNAQDRYETQAIDRGMALDDPQFFDDFYQSHGKSISSPIGYADWVTIHRRKSGTHFMFRYLALACLFGAFFGLKYAPYTNGLNAKQREKHASNIRLLIVVFFICGICIMMLRQYSFMF